MVLKVKLGAGEAAMDDEAARTRLLDAAEDLFYARGIAAVGMDSIRDASGVSLRRLYALFPAKEQLVEAYLERRDVSWRGRVADYAESRPGPERILAVFDWLQDWFSEPGFRGCAWINSYGELGSTSPVVAAQARRHKEAFRQYIRDLAAAEGMPPSVADEVYLLAEGAMVTAGIFGTPEAGVQARAAAARLLSAARSAEPVSPPGPPAGAAGTTPGSAAPTGPPPASPAGTSPGTPARPR
jgi:AcrR family transcriptional regulator